MLQRKQKSGGSGDMEADNVTTNCMCCYFCGAPLRWEADFSFTDYGIDDQQGVVSDYSCDNCDTSYQIFKPFKSEESEDN